MARPLWRTAWQFPKRENVELPSDMAIPVKIILPRELNTYVHTNAQLCMAALFITAKKWKQPENLATDEETNKVL